MDEFGKEEMEQLIAVFRHQSLEILDEMNQDLLALESRGADEETIERLRRAAHTIKGDSACVDLEGVTEVAHRIEDLISRVVAGKMEFEPALVDLVLDSLDSIRAAITQEELADIPKNDVERLCYQLAQYEAATKDGAAVESKTALTRTDEEEARKLEDGASHRKQDYVRVEASRIDALLNLAGEMVVARSMMNQIGSELEDVMPSSDQLTRFSGATMQMGKLIAELQKSVLKMRMVAISNVFKRFARPMRELAQESGKQVEFITLGGETELDRTLVDLIYEPLLHLLRNSVDHGLETPQEREAAGKPAAGSILLSAYHEGNQVVVEVADDGRGLDVNALKQKAVEMGVVTQTEASLMTDEEAFLLIFKSGFSTAKEITLVSGRGIGMAAVKTVIEQLRGSISVKSEKGIGTAFVLRMPLTLAIIKALLFSSSGRLYALPLLSVGEIAYAKPSDITFLDEFESYRLRDQFISLLRPGLVLGYDRRRGGAGAVMRGEKSDFFVIVIRVGSRRFGVVAESLLGDQELVIKPLDAEWLHSDVLAGASVLGDGRVVLILDAGALMRKAVRYERIRGSGIGAYGS
jgi:two-component system chemotaxis sensor kinase CheA